MSTRLGSVLWYPRGHLSELHDGVQHAATNFDILLACSLARSLSLSLFLLQLDIFPHKIRPVSTPAHTTAMLSANDHDIHTHTDRTNSALAPVTVAWVNTVGELDGKKNMAAPHSTPNGNDAFPFSDSELELRSAAAAPGHERYVLFRKVCIRNRAGPSYSSGL